MISFSSCKKDKEEIPGVTIPAIVTKDVSGITSNSAVIEGVVMKSGSSDVTARGVCWSTAPNPTLEDNESSGGINNSPAFFSKVVGLVPNTIYYVRAFATNGSGTSYGNEIEFTTILSNVATITTIAISGINSNGALSGGIITSNGGSTVTDWGVCWSTSETPTTNDIRYSITGGTGGMGNFAGKISGLLPTTTYYVRAYATNNAGTAYGNVLSFTTTQISPIIFNPDLTYSSVSDIEGNSYKTIRIGTQVWMAENLKTTRYNDGAPIPNVTGETEWQKLKSGGYCWYNNDASTFKETYGALYNWYAVTDSRKICPAGWHVPTFEDWKTLATYLGGEGVAGGKMKETGTEHWSGPNTGATNESGFTGLPVGARYFYLKTRFADLGDSGSWWSATSTDPRTDYAVFFAIESSSPVGYASDDWQALKSGGMPVRCLK
jgi:uncharacterized protein (TIGR02145 family)